MSAAAGTVLAAEQVVYRYPKQAVAALAGVDVTLRAGSVLGLLGPNGSGKSTLISVLMGLRIPQAGAVRRYGERAPVVSWVPQEYAFYAQLTCRENLRFFVSMLDVSATEAADRVARVARSCALDEFADQLASRCSGGVRRRLNIAIGLLQAPDVLLLDEPTAGVDPQSRAFLIDRVRELARAGTAVLYATHYMEEVSAACSEILLLDHGRVLADGDLATLLGGDASTPPFESLEALFMHHTKRSLRD